MKRTSLLFLAAVFAVATASAPVFAADSAPAGPAAVVVVPHHHHRHHHHCHHRHCRHHHGKSVANPVVAPADSAVVAPATK